MFWSQSDFGGLQLELDRNLLEQTGIPQVLIAFYGGGNDDDHDDDDEHEHEHEHGHDDQPPIYTGTELI